VAVQNANAKDNRPTFQNGDGVQAPAEGEAGAPWRYRRVKQDSEFTTP